ncbi:MAG: hypothetical protein SGJ21_03250 [Alphaproteobacteria bacterium]|nr:hypothetical protein [Alphaproteobacteria bacterium]
MHPIFITVKNTFTAIAAGRPASHLAAATLLGTSLYGVHEGAAAVLPAGLTTALTAAMIGAEWLQWTALGRMRAIEDASDDARALTLKGQCVAIGALQVAGYSLFIWNAGREAGMSWGMGTDAFWGVLVGAALFAALNFVAKWTSCDPVGRRTGTGPTGGSRIHDVMFSSPALPAPSVESEPARYTSEAGLVDFQDALRKRGELAFNEVDPRLAASGTRDAGERFKLWRKRERMRQVRAAA